MIRSRVSFAAFRASAATQTMRLFASSDFADVL